MQCKHRGGPTTPQSHQPLHLITWPLCPRAPSHQMMPIGTERPRDPASEQGRTEGRRGQGYRVERREGGEWERGEGGGGWEDCAAECVAKD